MRFPFGRYLILQGRLADIIDAGVAPAGCMRALQRPWIYRGNGHVISISLYRHGMLQRAMIIGGEETPGRDSLPRREGEKRTMATSPTRGKSRAARLGDTVQHDSGRWSGSEAQCCHQ